MRSKLLLLMVLLLSVVMYGSPDHLDRRPGEATVHLVGVDGFGQELGALQVLSFRDENSGQEFRERFQQNTADKIPYGVYHVRVGHIAYWFTEKTVFVFKPDVWAIVGLKVSELGDSESPNPHWVVSGTVNNIDPAEKPVFVKLLGLYEDYSVEDRVEASGGSGSFRLAGQNPQGRFLLITLGRTHVLDVREVTIPAMSPIEIDLGPSSPSPRK